MPNSEIAKKLARLANGRKGTRIAAYEIDIAAHDIARPLVEAVLAWWEKQRVIEAAFNIDAPELLGGEHVPEFVAEARKLKGVS